MDNLNGKMEFVYEMPGGGSVIMTLPADATLDEAIDGFEAFLHGAGYVFSGRLELNGNFVDYDSIEVDPGQN